MDELLREFIDETSERLELIDAELVRFEQNPDEGTLGKLLRLVHSVKGTCGFLGLPRLERLTHAAESLMAGPRDGMRGVAGPVTLTLAVIDRIGQILEGIQQTGAEPEGSDEDLLGELGRAARDRAAEGSASQPESGTALRQTAEARSNRRSVVPVRTGAAAATTIPVAVERIEQLGRLVSELVSTRNHLLELARRDEGALYREPLQRLGEITIELQQTVAKTRMQPIGSAWSRLPRLVRELSSELGKSIELVLEGGETELDRQVVEAIRDPLAHLLRNAAGHGLESAAERQAAGKPERGTIRLSASQEDGSICIEIADDGRGLDYEAIRREAPNRGLATSAELETMPDRQLAAFIFQPGFSTAREVTALSGRGIGLDVVGSNVTLLGGTVEVRSKAGQGTTFRLTIPATPAIAPASADLGRVVRLATGGSDHEASGWSDLSRSAEHAREGQQRPAAPSTTRDRSCGSTPLPSPSRRIGRRAG